MTDTRTKPAFNPSGARWCQDHERLECTKNRSKGRGACHAAAVRGLDACTTHAGHSREVAKAKGEARLNAWSAMGRPAEGQGIDASAAVLGMLQQSWLRAAMYSELLRQQATKDAHQPSDGFDPDDPGSASGLIGYRFGAAGKDGNIYAVSEEARALVGLEAAERDRVVKYAKTAHDMGISDRLTAMAEQWGGQVIRQIVIILGALNLTPEQEAMVPDLIQAHLGSIELTGVGGGGL